MGSGALAGSSFTIDRNAIARELGFSRITVNSLDAVSDRDFALDYLFALMASPRISRASLRICGLRVAKNFLTSSCRTNFPQQQA